MSTKASRQNSAAMAMPVRQPKLSAILPWTIKPRAMPNGQLDNSVPMAKTISRPANQSIIILFRIRLNSTAPAPLISRPAVSGSTVSPAQVSRLPPIISTRPAAPTARSPKRAPSTPPGNERKAPGMVYNPISVPIAA
jgi:hypothetical protein